MFSNSESESSDPPDYILDSSEEEPVMQIRIPIKNYPNNTEHEDDFPNGCCSLRRILVLHMVLLLVTLD